MLAQIAPAGPAPGTSFVAHRLRTGGFRPLWHQHPVFELNCIVEGRGTRWVGGASERFEPGSLVLVPPRLPHSWESDSHALATPSDAVVVQFARGVLGHDAQWPEWREMRALLARSASGIEFDDCGGRVRRRLCRLVTLAPPLRLAALFEALAELASLAARELGALGVTAGMAEDLDGVWRVIRELDATRGALPSQAAMAARLGLSPSAFSRQFRRATGRTYRAHVDQLRLDRACALLQLGRLRIADVALEAGFENLSNFNRRFRAARGETPREYARRFAGGMRAGAPAGRVRRGTGRSPARD